MVLGETGSLIHLNLTMDNADDSKESGEYNVKQFNGNNYLVLEPPPKTVVFQDHSPNGTALPDSRFLALHAAIAHVLHMSGAGKVLDLIMDKYSRLGPA